MKIYDYPLIDDKATSEKKVQQIKDYLYKLTDELNYNASMASSSNFFKEAVRSLEVSPTISEGMNIRDSKELLQAVLSFVAALISNEETALAKKITTLETEIRKLKGE